MSCHLILQVEIVTTPSVSSEMSTFFRVKYCSIGSLGKDYEEEGVENVTVKSARFENTQNGVRIKTWGRASKGYAKDVLFQHAIMHNVQNPIVIDQNYCPSNINCPGQVNRTPFVSLV